MASVATRSSMSSLSVPGSLSEANVDGLSVPFLYPGRPPPLHTSRARHPGRIDVSGTLHDSEINTSPAIAELIRSLEYTPYIQSATPRNTQETSQSAVGSSSSPGTTRTLPITRVRYNNSRLASSRGFNSVSKRETRVSPSIPRPIPGEFLEIESEFRQSSASSSPAASPSPAPLEPVRREEAPSAISPRPAANDPLTGQTCGTPELVSRQPSRPRRLYFENAPFETSVAPISNDPEEANSGTRPLLYDNSPLQRLEATLTYVPSLPTVSPITTSPIERPRAPSPKPLPKTTPPTSLKVPPKSPQRTCPGTPTKTRSCIVCDDSKSITDFPIWTTVRCTHPSRTCLDCLQSWIASSMDSKGWDRVTCSECDEKLDYEDMKTLASPEVFARFDALSTRAVLSTLPDFRWCRSPTCTSGQIHTGSPSKNSIFRCTSCRFAYCINHEREWHKGETCDQYDVRMAMAKRTPKQVEEERASEKKIKETTKKCPGEGCGASIEKNDGCDHMTCLKCKWEFCWLCLAPFEPIRKRGNKEHRSDCKYYA